MIFLSDNKKVWIFNERATGSPPSIAKCLRRKFTLFLFVLKCVRGLTESKFYVRFSFRRLCAQKLVRWRNITVEDWFSVLILIPKERHKKHCTSSFCSFRSTCLVAVEYSQTTIVPHLFIWLFNWNGGNIDFLMIDTLPKCLIWRSTERWGKAALHDWNEVVNLIYCNEFWYVPYSRGYDFLARQIFRSTYFFFFSFLTQSISSAWLVDENKCTSAHDLWIILIIVLLYD